jgi:hypothetical protein
MFWSLLWLGALMASQVAMPTLPARGVLYVTVCHFIVFTTIGHDSSQVVDSTT